MQIQTARNYGARYGSILIFSTQRSSNQFKIRTGNAKSPTPARLLCLSSRTQIELNGSQITPKYSARKGLRSVSFDVSTMLQDGVARQLLGQQ